MKKKNYVGFNTSSNKSITERFLSDITPTQETHGDKYNAVMGPFRSKLGALCQVHFGYNNPHTSTVANCERIAKKYKTQLQDKLDSFTLPF